MKYGFLLTLIYKIKKMKNNIKEINFGEGIGELKFGMTKDQVSSLLGKPDEIENIPGIDEEVNDDLVSCLLYTSRCV